MNLATGRPTTVSQVASLLSEGLGVSIEPEITAQYRAGDIRHCYGDTARAETLLQFRAATTVEDGMAELVAWLADQQPSDRVEAATAELLARGLAR